MNEDFITFDAACEYLGITSGQMYQYTHKRLFPFYKPFGQKLYFKKSELNAVIEQSRVEPVQTQDQTIEEAF